MDSIIYQLQLEAMTSLRCQHLSLKLEFMTLTKNEEDNKVDVYKSAELNNISESTLPFLSALSIV